MRNKITKLIVSAVFILAGVQILSAQVTAPLADGGYLVRLKESTGLMDNSGYPGSNNPNVGGWYPQASIYQRWILYQIEDGYYKIQSVLDDNAFVSVDGNSDNDDANIIQAGWDNTDYQKWEIKDNGNGYFKVISKGSGKAWFSLNPNNPDHAIARNIVQVGEYETDLEEFEFIPTADSVISGPYETGKSYIIASECTQMVMTEDEVDASSGNLVQRTYADDNAQRWQLDWVEDVANGGIPVSYYKITNRESKNVITLADTTTAGDGINVVTKPWSENPRMQLFQMWAIEPVVGIGDPNQVNVYGLMNDGRTIEIQGGPQWNEGQSLATWWKFENTADWERWQRWRFIMIDASPLSTKDVIASAGSMTIYPNPARDFCKITCESVNGIASVKLFDLTGKKVRESAYGFIDGANSFSYSLEGIQNGVYIIQVVSPDGASLTRKLLVE